MKILAAHHRIDLIKGDCMNMFYLPFFIEHSTKNHSIFPYYFLCQGYKNTS